MVELEIQHFVHHHKLVADQIVVAAVVDVEVKRAICQLGFTPPELTDAADGYIP